MIGLGWLGYAIFSAVLILVDRLTKYAALLYCIPRCQLHECCTFDLVFNRGMSFGYFYSQSALVFGLVTLFTILLTLAVLMYAFVRYQFFGRMIIGEMMVVAGSSSNIMDRLVYGGVVDFIEISYAGYTWPTFNCADVCIVVGVVIMIISYFRQQ